MNNNMNNINMEYLINEMMNNRIKEACQKMNKEIEELKQYI